ncbi:XTP/dITP diphosphohydrolase [Candidatus Thermokryptus mobilis]|uniref:dITP/XTP pyrophosphatase n=1 Tax=Candidatus Thermokryptus mobilis TaxID=1643428 RepID=A0A0S4MT75_9BACT|nr:RdgB/HAM1 family non-canonical purine NTP pyrophosphatase [Candidatus Thermokryptus mobilis]CUU01755.1 XTP/dITP diphosphohydrolase [Candidatus Thermokryptus mobilis]
MKIVLATRNKNKVEEIKQILKMYLEDEIFSQIEFLSSDDFQIPEIEEDGETYEENALKKAREVYKFTGLPSIADDSGIEVEILGGRPGVFSARYAGEGATDEENNKKLLKELENVPIEERKAKFKCVIAYVDSVEERIFYAETLGKVIFEPLGDGGFGYDPLFLPDGFDLTYAQLPREVKNRISHRSKALKKFAEFLTLKLKQR